MTQLRFSIGGESRNATRLYADASGFKVAVDHSEDRGGRTNAPSPFEYILAGFQNIDVDIQVYSDSDEEVLSRWLEVVETRCPIYDTLVNPTPVSLNVHKLECVYY